MRSTQPNYLLILLVAFVAAAAMWGGNRWVYTPSLRSNVDLMAPTVERLALLAQAPTPQPAVLTTQTQTYEAPAQDVSDGRAPLPRVMLINDVSYVINVVNGAGLVRVAEVWYACGADLAGLPADQALNIRGLCDVQENW